MTSYSKCSHHMCDGSGWRHVGWHLATPCYCPAGQAHKDGTSTTSTALEAELTAAKAERDAILDTLTPFNESIERGDGWYAKAHAVRYDQLMRQLNAAESRVRMAQSAIDGTLPAALLA